MNTFRVLTVRLLRWTESYMKTDMVYLAKGLSWLTAAQFVSALSAFLLALALANLLPKETYGSYKYILSIAAILGAVSLSGIGPIIAKAVRRGFEGILRDSMIVSIKWSVPVSLFALAMAVYYAIQSNAVLAISLAVVAVFTPILNTAQLYIWFLNGKEDFRRSSIYSALTSIIQALAIFAVVFLHGDVVMLVLAYFSSVTFANVLFSFFTVRFYKPTQRSHPEDLKFGLRLSFVSFFGVIAGNIDKILLFHFLGPVPVAVYALAQSPVVQMRSLLKLTTPLALPRLAAQDPSELYRTLQPKVDRFTLLTGAMVLVYVAAAPFLFALFFPKYVESVPYSQVYALLLLLYPKKLTALALLTLNRTRETYILSFAAPVVQTILIFTLIPVIGIWGAVVAEVAGSLAVYAASNYFFRRAAFHHHSKVEPEKK